MWSDADTRGHATLRNSPQHSAAARKTAAEFCAQRRGFAESCGVLAAMCFVKKNLRRPRYARSVRADCRGQSPIREYYERIPYTVFTRGDRRGDDRTV